MCTADWKCQGINTPTSNLQLKTLGSCYVATSAPLSMSELTLRLGFCSLPKADCGIKPQMPTVLVDLRMHPLCFTHLLSYRYNMYFLSRIPALNVGFRVCFWEN